MAPSFPYFFCIYLAIFPQSFSERRIKDGVEVTSRKRYAVYLLKAETAPVRYHGWMCGGAIIGDMFVLTSAACVQDVQHIYVVPGYDRYVPAERMTEDPCVKKMRKKVVLTCVPRNYRFDYIKTELWATADLAVVKVESTFFPNESYTDNNCSYTPQVIEFNTEDTFPKEDDDVIAMGWGHSKSFRKESDESDMNLEKLHYVSTKVMNLTECAEYYDRNKVLTQTIVMSMICTLAEGNLDENGQIILRSRLKETCFGESALLRGAVGPLCKDELEGEAIYEDEYYGSATVVEPEGRSEAPEVAVEGGPELYGKYNPEPFAEVGLDEYYDVDKAIVDLVNETRREVNSHKINRKRNGTDASMMHRSIRRRNSTVANKTHRSIGKQNSTVANKTHRRVRKQNSTVANKTHRRVRKQNSTIAYKTHRSIGKQNSTVANTTHRSIRIRNSTDTGKPYRRIEGEMDYDIARQMRHDEHGNTDEEVDKPGICQNDHGGPLVAWRGGREVVVAVATLYRLDGLQNCMGPYLFTRTACNGKFIDCIVNQDKPEYRYERRRCNSPKEVGFQIIRRHISWVGHKDGPADNEKI